MEKHFDEFLRIPRINKPEVNVHRLVDVALVAREALPAFSRMIEHFVQDIGRLFAAEDGKKNAAAENRIDEPGGVARQQPAIAG